MFRGSRLLYIAGLVTAVAVFCPALSAAAQAGSWTLTSLANPTNFAPGDASGMDRYVLTATNTSGVSSDGGTISVSDTLPMGLAFHPGAFSGTDQITQNAMECKAGARTLTCEYTGAVVSGDALVVTAMVDVEAGAPATVTNTATVSGGGLDLAATQTPTTISPTPPGFGVPAGGVGAQLSTTSAGAHPDITTEIAFNSKLNPFNGGRSVGPILGVANPKDIEIALPAGILGNPTAVPQCESIQLKHLVCPPASQVGLADLNVGGGGFRTEYAVYNMVPGPNEPAEFGFLVGESAPVYIRAHVRSDGDYGITTSLTNLPEFLPVVGSTVTLWGVPTDPSHDPARFNPATFGFGGVTSGVNSEAFLTNPTRCRDGELLGTLAADPWQAPGDFLPPLPFSVGEVTGCDQLALHPSIAVEPGTPQAGAPTGYTVDLAVPQSNDPAGLATPTLRDASVTLPAGTTLSPGGATGLTSCSDSEFAQHSLAVASCPSSSQIGTVVVHSPDLADPLEGQLFVGQPDCGPCRPDDAQAGRMIRLFLQAQGAGVIVKLEGRGSIDQTTGRLTTSFRDNPQLPFSELKLSLKGGSRADLANPTSCGVAQTTTDLTPWSAPETPDATPSSRFDVKGCGPAQFSPGFSAGTTNNQAGAFSPLSVTISRTDQDQDLSTISVRTPPGLLGMLSQVPLCPEPQASQGACGAQSLIGHTTVGAGPGPDPFYLGGSVYLTGPYKGAPFGLSIVVPVQAGPFQLETVVVRASISVDAHTSALTVSSDPLPKQLDGIPLHVRVVNVTVDRPGFTFNPTNCEAMSLGATLTSVQGISATPSSRFQAANCVKLPFKPSFTVSSQAKTSHASGASLDVRIGYPKGVQANIRQVAVSLPKQLPSRLTTIQKACLETTFAANPAMCPAGSNIGMAKAVTPLLNVPLTGPAYLVSHGGAAFPDLVIVLQGQGVTLDVIGRIKISKAGITSSTFNTVPDAPIASFELKLPEGPHSALTTDIPAKVKGSLCGRKLVMPTAITAQNGAQVEQSTKLAITGCPKKHKGTHKKR